MYRVLTQPLKQAEAARAGFVTHEKCAKVRHGIVSLELLDSDWCTAEVVFSGSETEEIGRWKAARRVSATFGCPGPVAEFNCSLSLTCDLHFAFTNTGNKCLMTSVTLQIFQRVASYILQSVARWQWVNDREWMNSIWTSEK